MHIGLPETSAWEEEAEAKTITIWESENLSFSHLLNETALLFFIF